MIPKKIHYCWFGRGNKTHLIRKCIETWRRVMPDYEIKEWNEDNFDINCNEFVRKAYEERKWAFVADVCRFYACYTEGGIYLDTDVEIFRPLDSLLNQEFFAGIEFQENAPQLRISIDVSAFGCIKGHPFALECLDYYKDKSFYLPDGTITGGTVQAVASLLGSKYGFEYRNEHQRLSNGVNIFPTPYFCNTSNKIENGVTFSLHHFDGSWVDYSDRGFLFRFCKKHDLSHIYKHLENLLGRKS